MEPAGNYMTVPAPSLSGESISQQPQTQQNGLANSEVYIAKVQNTMAVMEDQNMTNDPRYHGLSELKNRLQGSFIKFIIKKLWLNINFQENNR